LEKGWKVVLLFDAAGKVRLGYWNGYWRYGDDSGKRSFLDGGKAEGAVQRRPL
jgi:hypothetical protein